MILAVDNSRPRRTRSGPEDRQILVREFEPARVDGAGLIPARALARTDARSVRRRKA
jgi:hypothetical protein